MPSEGDCTIKPNALGSEGSLSVVDEEQVFSSVSVFSTSPKERFVPC